MLERSFESIALSDASPESAYHFISDLLGDEVKKYDARVFKDAVRVLGGRLTDLELYAQKVKAGQTPDCECFHYGHFCENQINRH